MINNDALELLNMFSKACNIARQNNKIEPEFNISEEELTKYLIQAFPHLKNNNKASKLAKDILNSNEEIMD